jgi:hypothetical protein
MRRTTYRQILSATHGVLNQISNHYRTGKWVGTLNDFVTYDESQTLTIPMIKDLLKAIKEGEIDLPISFLGGETIYVDTDIYEFLGERL